MEDALAAARFIRSMTEGKNAVEYASDPVLQSAVERQFEIVGEAVNRVSRVEPEVFARISHGPRIVGFRNLLIHGYDTVSTVRVWDIVMGSLPGLIQELECIVGHGTNDTTR